MKIREPESDSWAGIALGGVTLVVLFLTLHLAIGIYAY